MPYKAQLIWSKFATKTPIFYIMNRNNSLNKQITKIQKKAVGALAQVTAIQKNKNKNSSTKNKQQKKNQIPSAAKNHGIKKKKP